MANKEEDVRKKILIRLRRIEGQVRGIQNMIEDQADCQEILNQVAAVKSAVSQVGLLVFENHAQECIQKLSSGEKDEESLKEIMVMMGRLIK